MRIRTDQLGPRKFLLTELDDCDIKMDHCENCGSTDPEDLDGDDGYSACCNEGIVNNKECNGNHL